MLFEQVHEAHTFGDGEIRRMLARPYYGVDDEHDSMRRIMRNIGVEGSKSVPVSWGGGSDEHPAMSTLTVITRNHSACRIVVMLDPTVYKNPMPIALSDAVIVSGRNRIIDRFALEEFEAPSSFQMVSRLGMRPLIATRLLPWSIELRNAAGKEHFDFIKKRRELGNAIVLWCRLANQKLWPFLTDSFLSLHQ